MTFIFTVGIFSLLFQSVKLLSTRVRIYPSKSSFVEVKLKRF